MGQRDDTSDTIDGFRNRVAAMREVGCLKWGDIELGPAPNAPKSDTPVASKEEVRARIEADFVERFRVLYAASGAMPSAEEIRRLVDHEMTMRGHA